MIKLPTTTGKLRSLSTKVIRTEGKIQWQAVNETDPVRFNRLRLAWERLNTASHVIANRLGYFYAR